MFLNLTRKNNYFAVVKINSVTQKVNISDKAMKAIKSYFWWRGKKVEYFEPFTAKEYQESYVIFGTPKSYKTMNRKCFIFIMELYASLKDKSIPIDKGYEEKIKECDDCVINFYKVR